MDEDPSGQYVNGAGTAGVIGRPPLLFLGVLVLGLASDHVLPVPSAVPGADARHWVVAGFLILVGLTLAAAGIRNFSRAATPVPTNQPSRALVTTGVHGLSRNPIYLGMFLMYDGIGVAALALTIRYGVVAREEAYLERRFGDAYRNYRDRVRRWL